MTILAAGCAYALAYSNFVYLCYPISLLHACVSQWGINTCMRGRRKLEVGSFPAGPCLALVPGQGCYVLARVEKEGLSCIFSLLCRCYGGE